MTEHRTHSLRMTFHDVAGYLEDRYHLQECKFYAKEMGMEARPADHPRRSRLAHGKGSHLMEEFPQCPPGAIFVFGANRPGRHGKGAAHTAVHQYGAVWGAGEGLHGQSYAIPTKDGGKTGPLTTLPLDQIEWHVIRFLQFAAEHPEMQFFVTRIGCGLAGYFDDEIAPFFAGATDNVILPAGWR